MFAGVLSLNEGGWSIARPTAAEMAAPFAVFGTPDVEGTTVDQAAILYERRRWIGPNDRDIELPHRCPVTGSWVAFWGRIDNRVDLARAIALPAGAGEGLSDAALVATAWPRLGKALPGAIVGDFALAVVDPARRSVFLARDPMGIRPLYYRLDNGICAFASTAAALKLAGLPLTPDREWIARYLWSGLSMDPERTAYVEIQKLPGGHTLSIETGAGPKIERWHHWHDDPPGAGRRDPRWVEAYRAVLDEAVACRLPSDYRLGVENSGGLDSATLLALAARSMDGFGDRLRAYSFATYSVEPGLILATSQAHRVRHNYVVTSSSTPEQGDYGRVLAAIGYPPEHSNAIGYVPFYRDARLHGVRTLFSGFGGDEAVTSPAHHAPFELARAGHYGALFDMMRGPAFLKPLRLMKQLLRRRRPATNDAALATVRRLWPECVLRDSVVEEFGIERAYFETARYDAPYAGVNDFILGHHLSRMQVTTRLENCSLAAAAWGIEYRWPLLDVRLVQQYLSTPTIEKFGPNGMGRYLHRRAVDDVVPAQVAWKPSKHMGSLALEGDFDTRSDRIRALAAKARDEMHETVASVVDLAKLDRQLHRLGAGSGAGKPSTIERTASALAWLNRWLVD